ncbi:hypothetical protein ABV23_RS00690 [Escherichia coli]|nr:hypothetical protein [Escherichia coli]
MYFKWVNTLELVSIYDDKSYDTFLCAKNKSMFLKLGKDLYVLGDVSNGEGGILKTIGDVVNIKFNKGVYSGSSGKIDWVSTDTGCYDFTGTASKDGSYATNLVSYYKDYNIQLRSIENVKAISREELEKIMEKEEFDALPDEVKDSSSTANISSTKDFDQIIMISAKSLFNTILDTLHIKHK